MARIVIIGAGLTGISVAYHLDQIGFSDYLLLEQEDEVGGLCRSFVQDGFTFDYTGHLLHLSDPYARSLVLRAYAQDQFAQIARRAAIFSHNVYTKYPFQINLQGLPPEVIVECIEGYLERPPRAERPASFRDWVLATFGAGMGKHFFFPYQQKIFDIDLDELSASWTDRFVPPTSLREMLYGALGSTTDTVGYNAQFLYPRVGGIMPWVTALHANLRNPARTGYRVTAIDGVAHEVVCANGHREPFDLLISTMPLDHMLQRLHERSDTQLRAAASHLRCNSVINLNLGVRRPQLHAAHWIYYPEPCYPFYRIGFPSNLTATMAPAGCSSLSGESAALYRTPEDCKTIGDRALMALRQLFAIGDEELVTQVVKIIPHAYVIFDRWRDQHLSSLLAELRDSYAIYSVGRYGAWKYSSMQDAVLDGRSLVAELQQSGTLA